MVLDFSNWAIFKFLIVGVLLWLLLRLLKHLSPFLIKRKENKKYISRYMPSFELFLWFIFIVISIDIFLKKGNLVGYGLFFIVFLFIIWFAFFVLKDLVSGAIFKLTNHFSINDTLKVGKYSGKIVNFGRSSLELETENGKSIYIPYSKILNKVNIKTDPAEKISRYNFKLETNKDISLKAKTEKIKQAVMVLPWSSIKKSPLIKPIEESEKSFVFEIAVFSLEKEYFHKIENNIKKQFNI